MAYPTRGRDPLLDTETQAFLERRGREALGVILLIIGVFTTVMMATYSAEDPGWMVAGTTEVQNWTGKFGASIAAPVLRIIGFGAWSVVIVFLVWGFRFLSHRGTERALSRLTYAPIFWVLAAIYAATLTPNAEWTYSFSMGGLFGDTALFMLLQILPGSAALGANLVALVLGLCLLSLGIFILGFTFAELRSLYMHAKWYGAIGLVAIMRLLGRGATAGYSSYKKFKEAPVDDQMVVPQTVAQVHRVDAMPAYDHQYDNAAPMPEPEAKRLFSRVPGLLKRTHERMMPQAEEPTMVPLADPDDMVIDAPQDDRIKAKISDAIRSRVRAPNGVPTITQPQAEPPLRRPTKPHAMIVNTAPPSAPLDMNIATPEMIAEPVESFDPLPEIPVAPVQDQAVTHEYTVPSPPPAQEPVQRMAQPVAQIPTAEPKRVVQHPVKKPAVQSERAKKEAQPNFSFDDTQSREYEVPPLSLLTSPGLVERHVLSDEALEENARMLENVLDDYGVRGEIVSVRPGPVVTMYELEPAPGLKASRVIGLADDIARSMSALAARVSTVPGRSVIGIELPNQNREKVVLREILSTRDFDDNKMRLPLALGKDIGGEPIVANLAKMPHLLIAGTTGSGKSVAINTMILSLLYKLSPDECRMIMIDPKMLELSVYDGIPHLLSPVVTDPKKAVVALKWVVGEMEERYRKMSKMGVRNIDGFNGRVRDALGKGEMFSRTVQTGFDDETGEPIFETEEFQPEVIPYIVVVVDEMADLMMVAGKEIEACIQRLAQMARASGIHLIMATQRPSVDVITGTIKANFPTRISFQVTSKVDSRTILGEMGAEQLLGMGDMLYMAGGGKITRVHGPFCSDEEVEEIVNYLKSFGPPAYIGGVVDGPEDGKESDIDLVLGLGGNTDGEDALYDTAVQIVIKDRKCSTSYIQRKLAIGYNKAARLVEQMEDNGLVSPANHVGKREILIPEQG